MTLGERESGHSLVEILIAAMLSLTVIGLLSTALATTHRGDAYSADQSRALAELRTATERLGKELRQAQRLYADSGPRTVRLWVDRGRDGVQHPSERVTWSVRPASGGGAQLVRSTDAEPAGVVVATNLLGTDSFCYVGRSASGSSPAPTPAPAGSACGSLPESLLSLPASAGAVRIQLIADVAVSPRDEGIRSIRTEVKLRNVSVG